jgi:hypothetical protein
VAVVVAVVLGVVEVFVVFVGSVLGLDDVAASVVVAAVVGAVLATVVVGVVRDPAVAVGADTVPLPVVLLPHAVSSSVTMATTTARWCRISWSAPTTGRRCLRRC